MAISDPRDIPGLVAWYSAEAEIGYADGAAMTAWTDLSGNGNHATAAGTTGYPTWKAAAGPSGGPAVTFNQSQGAHFTLPNLMAGATGAEVFVRLYVHRDSGLWDFNASSSLMGFSPNSAAVYESFGWSSGRALFDAQASVHGRWMRYSVRADAAGAWSAWIDGVQQHATTGVSVGVWDAAPRLAKSQYNNLSLDGSMPVFLLFNRVLTSSERTDLEVWMAANPSGGTTAAPSNTLVGTLGKLTGSLVATYAPPPVTSTLAGNLPKLSGTFSGSLATGPNPATLAGTLPALQGSLSVTVPVTTGTDTATPSKGIAVLGRGYVESNPPIVEPPSTLVRGHSYVKAQAYTAPTMVDGRPIDLEPTYIEAKAHRDRIIVGGKDITFFRGVQTPTPGFRLTEPFAYGATTLVFPQTHAVFEKPGAGELAWLAKEKKVRIQRIDVDTKTGAGIDYYGVITAVRMEGRHWVADVGGDLSGRAMLRHQPLPLWRVTRDIQRHVHDAVRALNLRVRARADIGIRLAKQGGFSTLDWLNHLCANAVKKDGTAYTLMPAADNAKVWEFREKDTTTRHCTLYFDDARIVADLVDDLAERPNRIYATGVTPDGMVVKNGRYPGLKQGDPPAYPFGDSRSFGIGDDLSTATPGSIAAMNWALVRGGFMDDRTSMGVFDSDTKDAVEELQDDAGLLVTGRMNVNTWDALFDLNVTGFNLRQSNIEPMAQATHVRKWNYTASGAKASRNTAYDPTRLVVDRSVDFGAGHKKGVMVRWARQERLRNLGKNWVGTVKVNLGGVIRGEHTPGAPLTSADVMPFRELRPGMNAWAPLFDGGTQFRIVGIDVDPGGKTGTLTLDTKNRDLMTVAEIVMRNRESRRDPARAWLDQHRSSKLVKDSIITFDEVGGRVFNEIICPANQWTVFPVAAGQEGTIRKIKVQTANDPAAYCLTVWGRNPFKDNLDKKIPTPLAIDEDGATVWDENLAVFDNRVLLYAAGTEEQPCGYWPEKHTNDKGDTTAHPVTGKWVDDAGFSYHTQDHPVLWVAIWPTSATTIEPQQIVWPQLEAGS